MKKQSGKAKRKYHCPLRELQKHIRPDTGKRIRELRKAHHYSQQTLSNLIGVSRSAISNWETFKRTPTLRNYAALARTFHVSVFSFVKISEFIKNK